MTESLKDQKKINELRLEKRKKIKSNFQRTQVEIFQKLINPYIVKNTRILEIGCSYGFWLDLLSPYTDNLTGIDIYNSMAPSLKKKIKFKKGDGTKIPFQKNTFDIVYSVDVIEHVQNDLKFVQENYRVLKNNGIFILGTPKKTRLSASIKKLLLKI